MSDVVIYFPRKNCLPCFHHVTPQIIRRRPGRYDTDNTLENLTVKAATGEKRWPVSTAFA
ncbi:hypothetical protein DPA23_03655 [Salmonella enterica subsp. enterica serovar Virchow]|nr:hypothetical protein [Salmonella enterica subsp. enterica serovar Virchow]